MKTIALFEDDAEFASALTAGARPYRFVQFDPVAAGATDNLPPEKIAEKWLRSFDAPPELVVTDRDLSKIRGLRLSANAVIEASKQIGIPICIYARNLKAEEQREMDRRRKWSDGYLALEGTVAPKQIAAQIRGAAQGFERIRAAFDGAKKGTAPAQFIAELLGDRSLSPKLSLFMAGDSDKLTDILTRADLGKRPSSQAEIKRRVPVTLGNWLWESVLRYPGIVLSDVAAASYLNVELDTFRKDAAQEVFRAAVYAGPFHAVEPRWFRHKLDKLITKAGVKDGRQLLEAQLGIKVRGCACSIDPKVPAGYLCILTNKPVSKQNSIGGISWIPTGADLARVSRPLYEELAVWLGL